MRKQPLTYDAVRHVALPLPHVEKSTSYGTPALKTHGQLLIRLHEDMDKIVVKMPFDRREELTAADPQTYFITDHYRNDPWILVSLSRLHPVALPELLQTAHRAASAAKKHRV